MDELFFLNLNQDYERFMHRIIIFYRLNFEAAKEGDCPIAKKKLDMFINKILPSPRELKKILVQKRKQIKTTK